MGLDISAYSRLKLVENVALDSHGDPVGSDDLVRFPTNSDFPGREQGLIDRGFYRVEGEDLYIGCGSYGSYNRWRNDLAKLAGYPEKSHRSGFGSRVGHDVGAWEAGGGPFWEQITFSDCEGTIGPVVAAKLAKDYADFESQAEQVGGHFWSLYQRWKKAFEMAADGGAVVFH